MDTSQAEIQQLYNRLDHVVGKPESDRLMNLLTHTGASQVSVDALREDMNQRFEEMNREFHVIHDRFDRLYSALIVAGASAFVGFVGAMVTIILRT